MYILHIMHPESISDIFGKASVTKRIIPVSWKVLDERYVNLFVRRSCSDLI